MQNVNTPNGIECIVLEKANSTQYFDDDIINVIKNEVKGPKQEAFIKYILTFGYIYKRSNGNANKSLDNLVDRIQKKFTKLGAYAPEYNLYKIYYGQIGKNGEFGYYLQYQD